MTEKFINIYIKRLDKILIWKNNKNIFTVNNIQKNSKTI